MNNKEIKALAASFNITTDRITKDGDNLTVGGYLDLRGTSITALPDNLTVGGGLYLRGTSITALPDNLTVGGGLYLEGTSITALPDNLTVGGYLYLRGTSITALPDNLTVGGGLDLEGTSITALPDNLTVGGGLYLRGTSITVSDQEKVKRPSSALSISIKASIEVRFNLRGYSIVDNILSKVLSTKGSAKRIQIVGQKNSSYLVTDGSGNFAHGKTIKQAREDLVYKMVAKFDGDLPESATGKEWVGIYRSVTGACSSGVKHFVESRGIALEGTYTAKKINEMVHGQFGAEKFSEMVRLAV